MNLNDVKYINSGFGWNDSDSSSWNLLTQYHKTMIKSYGLLGYNLNDPYIFANTESNNLVDEAGHLSLVGNNILAKKLVILLYHAFTNYNYFF